MTAPSFLSTAHRAEYAAAAAFERDERERLYPARVQAGKLPEEQAQADWLAWVAIARWCGGERIAFDISLAEMEHAAAQALQVGERAVAKAPDDPTRVARRDTVAEILTMIQRTREWLDDLNAALRREAGRIAA